MGFELFKRLFQLLTITLLSLLIPLSFLLLSRLVCSRYMQVLFPLSNPKPTSFLVSANPIFLSILISFFTIATLLHGFLGKASNPSSSSSPISQPRLNMAWVALCVSQLSLGLGIEDKTALAIDNSSFGSHRILCCRAMFFLGLHETMRLWSKTVVKPVVDDTVYGAVMEESWVERVTMAMSFGALWWLRLKDEVEALTILRESKMKLLIDLNSVDFLGWGLYYLTVTIGVVKILKSIVWLGKFLLGNKERKSSQFYHKTQVIEEV